MPSVYLFIGYVQPWKLITLELCDVTNVICDIEFDDSNWGMEGGSNNLAYDLEVGDNFAVRVEAGNAEKADFYILKCLKTLHPIEVNVALDDLPLDYDQFFVPILQSFLHYF